MALNMKANIKTARNMATAVSDGKTAQLMKDTSMTIIFKVMVHISGPTEESLKVAG